MPNSYQVIARKWRPQTFDDVVGQDHLVRTLKNAITRHRIAHAYLFVGPRGTGKTSVGPDLREGAKLQRRAEGRFRPGGSDLQGHRRGIMS